MRKKIIFKYGQNLAPEFSILIRFSTKFKFIWPDSGFICYPSQEAIGFVVVYREIYFRLFFFTFFINFFHKKVFAWDLYYHLKDNGYVQVGANFDACIEVSK